MKLNKKTIMIISGISVAVVVLSLGVGLGVGLSLDSSSSSSGGSSSEPIVTGSIYRAASYAFNENDIENKKSVTIDGEDYSVDEEEGKYYLNVPATNDLTLSSPTIVVPKMFDTTEQVVYNSLTKGEIGEGKDGFYQVDFMEIDAIKIIDTIIYGGFEKIKNNQDIITGYRLHHLLDSDIYPNGYQIGSFDENGGGINMLKLEKLKYLIDGDDTTTEANAKTTTTFGFFSFFVPSTNKIYVRVLTSSNPENNLPENIGINLQQFNTLVTRIPQNSWYDYTNKKEITPIYNDVNAIIGFEQRSSDIDFKVGYFKKRDGSDYILTWAKDDEVYATKEIPLNDLYMPITFEGGSYIHNILGSIKQSKDGKIHLSNNFKINKNESKIIDVVNSQFSLPNIKLLLEKAVFNDEVYATESINRSTNELLINADETYIDYFRKIANLQEVKNLAKKYGVTIRFKINDVEDESNSIKSKGSFDNTVSELFFPSINNLYDFKTKEMVAPLKFKLKSNLENEDYFIDMWRRMGKIGVENSKDQFGLYPFSQSTQFIAYNKDYLPNGFDFINKDLSDYLYVGSLGGSNEINTFISEENVNEQQKTSLWIQDKQQLQYEVIWGNDFYPTLKKDQKEFDSDLAWRVKDSKNDFYSLLLDPSLKNDKRFKAWIDHYKNANEASFWYPYYKEHALFNGHIGGILIDSPWVWYDVDWTSGALRSIGTDEEKRAFALNKIGFQPIPGTGTLTSNGPILLSRLSAMTASLKNDEKKQEVAEMFIHMLTTHNNFLDLAESLSIFTPRKDINVDSSNNKPMAQLIKTMANTQISISYKFDFLNLFHLKLSQSRTTLDSEIAINNFKTALSLVNYNVLVPENT